MAIPKSKLKGYVGDMFADFLYYDRKEDDEFTLEDAENLPNIISHEEMLTLFFDEINRIYEEK